MDEPEHNFDKILIKDLLLRCIIGVNDYERKEKQDILINIVMWTDLSEGEKTDDIKKTLNYRDVNNEIVRLVERSKFFLVETLAETIAQICLRYDKIKKVKVTVEKPGALRFARSVGVEITRQRE